MSATEPGTPPRTLADQLRGWSNERLADLLRARPDLATPAPHDSAQLASRAATRSSVLRALDGLSRLELSVLDALVIASQTTQDQLVSLVHADPDAVRAATDRLADLALIWGSPSGLRPLTGIAEVLRGTEAAGVSGLRPVSAHGPDAATIGERIDRLSTPARTMLEHLAERGGEGKTGAGRPPGRPEEATTPVEELLAHGLLVPRGQGVVHLPGEVGLALRGGRTTTSPVDDVPTVSTSGRDPALVDKLAAGAAFDAVRRVELLLDHWGLAPPGVLRAGGLAVRDLKAASGELHVTPVEAGLLVEVAHEAGLLAESTDPDGEAVWLPTDTYDSWSAGTPAERWAALARAWLESPRLAGLIGSRDSAGKTWNALAPDLSSTFAAEARRMALAELADLPPGATLATGTGLPGVVARVAWKRPRRPATRADMVAWALAEAGALGLTGYDGISSAGRHLLAGDPDAAAAALAPLLPAPVDHVLVQADLTAVAPGPLEPTLSRTLHLLADVESRGGATVYRFAAASVRRAFDAGWSAAEVHEFLASVSRTPLPQPLTYLVDDVARTFGTLRVGHAEAFLRADDESALTELMHHPKASTLGLRRLAPTVLVSTVPVDVLLPRLRELGSAPVVEAADGTVRVARRDLQRARTPRHRRPPAVRAARETATVTAVVTAIRAGDRASASRPSRPADATSPQAALAALRLAIDDSATVLIGYVDNHGSSSDRLVDPMRVEGGQLTAHDHRSDDTRTFAVHRITTVRPVADP